MNASGWGLALLFCGAYLLPASATELALANALAEEGDWEACRIECLRAAAAKPGLAEIRELQARVDSELSVPKERKSIWHRAGGWPIRVLVGFYRSAIGPPSATGASWSQAVRGMPWRRSSNRPG